MASRRLALAAAVFVATPVTAALAPMEHRTYRLETITERDDGATKRRFAMTRDLVFQRTADGFVAEVTIRTGTSDDPSAGGFYARALAGLAGKAVRFRLDHDGRVLAIDDLDATWERLAAAVDAMAPGSGAEGKSARRMADILRALPADKRLAMLGSIVAPLSQPMSAVGTRAITIAGDTIDGRPVRLSGNETVQRLPSGLLAVDRSAQDLPTAPMTVVTSRQTIDPATGLLITGEARRTLKVATDPTRRLIITDQTTLTPMVS